MLHKLLSTFYEYKFDNAYFYRVVHFMKTVFANFSGPESVSAIKLI